MTIRTAFMNANLQMDGNPLDHAQMVKDQRLVAVAGLIIESGRWCHGLSPVPRFHQSLHEKLESARGGADFRQVGHRIGQSPEIPRAGTAGRKLQKGLVFF